MFLTTNRLNNIDAAFESRIHLIIHYPALDTASRLHIWKTFVHSMGKVKHMEHTNESDSNNRLSDLDLKTLAANHEINGREIKNVIKTARLLAKQQDIPLGLEHIDMVLRVKRGVFK
jgi:ATP-dependent 26S proteasome regulatory subunit